MNIFKFEFKRQFKYCLVWSSICSFLIVFFMSIFPSMKSSLMKDIVIAKLDMLPNDFLTAFNFVGINLTNIIDFLAYCMQYISLVSGIYASILGVSLLIKEETDKTIGFLYSKPVTRKNILTSKIIAASLIYLLYICIVTVFVMIICFSVKPHEVLALKLFKDIISISLGTLFLGYIFMGISIFISTIIKSSKQGISIAAGLFFITYFLGIIGKLNGDIRILKYLSPAHYVIPSNIIKNGFEIKYVLIGCIIILISIMLSYITYSKKDMRV